MSLILCSRPVAIVTGSLRGIGRECALELGKAGFNILLNDREIDDNRGAIQDLRDELRDCGADSIPFLSDVANVGLHATMLEAAVNRWGRFDCLLNNAGIPSRRRCDILDVEPDTFDECISVNTRAVFFLSQAVARYMLSQDDRHDVHRSIINATSNDVKAVSITRSEYCVSKAASSMTTKLFALRLASGCTKYALASLRPK